ncbi:MAG: transposase, partial [Oscillatoriales cyanobacterium]
MYAVQRDLWHLTGLDKTIVEQLLRWSNNLFNVGTYESRQRYFKYRTKGAMYQVSYPGQALKIVGNRVRLPLGTKGKEHFGTDALWVTLPERLKDCQIKELRLIPRNGEVWLEYVHESLTEQAASCSLEVTGVLGIDHGINNWLTCV